MSKQRRALAAALEVLDRAEMHGLPGLTPAYIAIGEALAELEQAQQEPAQAVGKVVTVGGYPDDSRHTVEWLVKHKDLHDGQLLYAVPPAIDDETKKMVLELCNKVLDYNYVEDEFDIELAKQIREKLEAGE